MRLIRRLVIFAVLAGLVLKGLRALGIVGGGECDVACACSGGALECRCGHRTCLAPAA